MRTRKRATTALSAALAAAMCVPAIAQAATVTVTGDAGSPVALTPGAPTTIRNMDVDLGATFDASEKYYAVTVTGPVGAAASPSTCSSGGGFGKSVDYQGNGTYKLKVKLQERSATGKVRLKVKRGKHGRFKSIGKAKIRNGKFKKRFTLRKTGRYRLKYIYKGSATVAPGTVQQKFRIVRRRFV